MPRRLTPDPTSLSVGTRVAKLRRQRGLSIKRLAAASAQSGGHLSNVEHGLVNVTVGTLVKLAEALGTTPMYFLLAPDDSEVERCVEQLHALPLKVQRRLAAKLLRALGARPEVAPAATPAPAAGASTRARIRPRRSP